MKKGFLEEALNTRKFGKGPRGTGKIRQLSSRVSLYKGEPRFTAVKRIPGCPKKIFWPIPSLLETGRTSVKPSKFSQGGSTQTGTGLLEGEGYLRTLIGN